MTEPATATVTESATIAVCTYLRPDDLRRTVDALREQALEVDADVDVLVVDNDPAGGARSLVTELAAADPRVAVRYAHEPRPGIAAARNRCLDEATHDLLVFVDDDEHPRPGWLQRLLAMRTGTGATAVAGPVESEFDAPLDPWIVAGGFFVRGRFPTGSQRPVAATNNLLLDRAAVAAAGVRFDERFGLTGGSDTVFTRDLVRAGGRIVWCDDAVMVDRTPPERATRAWVLRRVHRFGNAWAVIAITDASTPSARAAARARAVAEGTARIASGWAQVGVGVLTGSLRARARGRRRVSRGAGYVSGALGRVHAEYARPDGSS